MTQWNWIRTFIVVGLLSASQIAFGQSARERLSTIPGDSLAIISVDLAALRQHPELDLMPWEVISVATQEQLGVDLLKATAIEVAIGVPMPMPEAGAAIICKQPVNIADLLIPDLGEMEKSPKKPELRFRQFANQPIRVAQIDPSTVFVGTANILNRMITGSSIKSKALDVAKESKEPVTVVVALEKVRPIILGFLNGEAGNQVPPEMLAPLKSLVQESKVIRLTSTIGMTATLKLDLFGNSAESMATIAKSMDQLREAGIAMAEEQIELAMEQSPEMSPAMKAAVEAYIQRLKQAVQASHWTIEGDRLHAELQAANSTATIGVLTGLLLPAVQAARQAARRMSSMNNLKQLALAMHNYESTFGKLPPRAICDKDGTPLLSWRVALLPYIEEGELYKQFHLDEPWDSDHNKELIGRMPPLFASPQVQNEPGHTNYVMPFGEGLPGSEDKLRFADILDGTSNTIALIEVGSANAVPWTAPVDFDVDEEVLTQGFPENGQGANAAFYDGSVRFLSQFIDQNTLQSLLTHDGGEVATGF